MGAVRHVFCPDNVKMLHLFVSEFEQEKKTIECK